MRIVGRKTSAAYELYGFIHKVDNGKHSAICTSCNRVLQNTAAVRLQKHRNSCLAARVTGDPTNIPVLERKNHLTLRDDHVKQNENINSNVKIEQNNIELEAASLTDSANDNTVYEDSIEATNRSKRTRTDSVRNEITKKVLRKSTDLCNTINQDENSMLSPEIQIQAEPFESYTAANMALDIDNETDEVDDEDLINIEKELDLIQDFKPRSKELMQLQVELSKAETEYYRNKSTYFTKLTENCKIKRTLMLLESRKLQLEIEKLTNDS